MKCKATPIDTPEWAKEATSRRTSSHRLRYVALSCLITALFLFYNPLRLLHTRTGCETRCSTLHLSQSDWLTSEIDFLANLKTRLAGSENHNQVIDHIQHQLEDYGHTVQTDLWPFNYFDGPKSPPSIKLPNGESVSITSWVPYSGVTPSTGVAGPLVNLITNSISAPPNWALARDAIAITNITALPTRIGDVIDVWPGSPDWDNSTVPTPELDGMRTILPHLAGAAAAGVKAVIYIWEGAPRGLLEGQYVPHENLFTNVPAVFVNGPDSAAALIEAAKQGESATVTLHATMDVEHPPLRTIYTVIPGTELRNESMILGTHTDGFNLVEENGHIALLAHARKLAEKPPRRTTVLLFIGTHLSFPAVSPPPFRGTSRFLSDHPELWAGLGDRNSFGRGGQLKGVVSTSVEHLGAVHFETNGDTWVRTNETEPELMGASTAELNELVQELWTGADPEVTRVNDASTGIIALPGEAYPYQLVAIPNLWIITAPDYLLKIFPEDFDQKLLVDLAALERQVDSFLRIWERMDGMSGDAFGTPRNDGRQTPIRVTNP